MVEGNVRMTTALSPMATATRNVTRPWGNSYPGGRPVWFTSVSERDATSLNGFDPASTVIFPVPVAAGGVAFEGSSGKSSTESPTPSPSESEEPVPVSDTAAFGVSGSFELTVTVAPKGPPSACGANVTSIVQLPAGAIVGVALPHGFDPPERFRE